MPRKSLIDRRDAARQELVEARERFAKLQQETAERIGRLAVKTGFADLGMSDAEVVDLFKKIVSGKLQEGTK